MQGTEPCFSALSLHASSRGSLFFWENWSTREGPDVKRCLPWYLMFLSRPLAYSTSPVCKTLKLILFLFVGRPDRLVDHHWVTRFWILLSFRPGYASFGRGRCSGWSLSLQSLFPQDCQMDQIWSCGRFLLWSHRVWRD